MPSRPARFYEPPLNVIGGRERQHKRPALRPLALFEGIILNISDGAHDVCITVEEYFPALPDPGAGHRKGMPAVSHQFRRRFGLQESDDRLNRVAIATDDHVN